jgi:hypothetical protein
MRYLCRLRSGRNFLLENSPILVSPRLTRFERTHSILSTKRNIIGLIVTMPKAQSGFFAVKKGRIPGIYRNWDDCEEQVKGIYTFLLYLHLILSNNIVVHRSVTGWKADATARVID